MEYVVNKAKVFTKVFSDFFFRSMIPKNLKKTQCIDDLMYKLMEYLIRKNFSI